MHHYFVYAEGGLGDIIANYHQRPDFRRLRAFKEANPDAYVRLVVTGQNAASPDFFRHHPYIDDIAYSPWIGDVDAFRKLKMTGLTHFQGFDQAGREYPEEHPPVYLSPFERRLVDKVKSAGRYVAWHPWGGDGHRNFNNIFDLEKMIDLILAQGWNLVVVGGKSLKIDHEGHLPVDHIPASREGHPRIFNMIPYSNVRVCAALVGEAPRFMGTDSCFAVHAALNKVYSLVSTCNNYWDGGCPLIIREGPTWLIHFDIWRRKEARLEEVIPSFLPRSANCDSCTPLPSP